MLAETGDQAMSKFVTRFAKNESGATAIEYGLIVALIAVFIIGAVSSVGSNLSTKFNTVAASL
jgi:pilus assembly protein Flp/PilA